MALGSWQGLYNAVILDLMAQQRERPMLLLMAIATNADLFGFAFPGRARQMAIRHCSKSIQQRDEKWLVDKGYITVEDIEDFMTRQTRPFYQVSPRVIYIRPELQAYCEAVFDGLRYRDIAWEKKIDRLFRTTGPERVSTEGVNHSSTNDSQPESYPESEPDPETSVSNQHHTQTHNQRGTTPRQRGPHASTMRNGTEQGEAQPDQRRKAQDRKNTPPGGASGDEFAALISPTVDDERMVQEIRHVATTTEYQARSWVEIYPREAIVDVMRRTAKRRQRGELSNPGAWFFTTLKRHYPIAEDPTNPTMPNGQTYQDWENEKSEDVEL